MKKLIVCVTLCTAIMYTGSAQADEPSENHCKDGSPITVIEYDVQSDHEVRTFTGLDTPCTKIVANVYDDEADSKVVEPQPNNVSSYDPNKDNELLGIMEDAVDGVNNLNDTVKNHDDRISELETRKPVPGPRGPRGLKGESSMMFHVGPSVATMVGLAEGHKPTVGGGLVLELGTEKVWASYHGYLGSDGEGGGIGTNLHNSLAVMIRCGSEKFSCGLGAVDSRFLYFREKEGNAQRTDMHYMGLGPQFQAHLNDQLRLGFSGSYGLASRETPEMVVKYPLVEVSVGLSILLN